MNSIIKFLEKYQHVFDRISKNIYLLAVKDGFLSNMPIVLFSSLFLLVSTLPPIVGIELPGGFVDFSNKIYGYTMGVVGIMVAGSTANSLAMSMNRRLPDGKAINPSSTMVTAMCAMLILSVTKIAVEVDGANLQVFDTAFMGTKGFLAAFVAAFITVNIYKFCVLKNITIKLPKEVPGAIAQSFADIFAFGFTIIAVTLIDYVCRVYMAQPFANLVSTLISPLFSAVDSYSGLAFLAGAVSLFQFVGIHGSSVVMAPLNAALFGNMVTNLEVFQAGGHPTIALTQNFSFFWGFGGSGATFVVPIIMVLLMRSKQMKAMGKASLVPVIFGVNEPVLFGMPIVLNPYMFVPFLITPMVNAIISKFFIDFVGMNAPMYVMPWALPSPIGGFLTTGLQAISLVCFAILFVVDFAIYYPFVRAYDLQLCKEEAERDSELEAQESGEAISAVEKEIGEAVIEAANEHPMNVLVLCQGAGTSTLLSNALKEGAKSLGINLTSRSGAYGSHYDILDQFNIVVLAPQARMYYNDMKSDTDRLGITLLTTKGKQYIDLTNDPEGAIAWLMKELEAQKED